jgi:hypothetical protein
LLTPILFLFFQAILSVELYQNYLDTSSGNRLLCPKEVEFSIYTGQASSYAQYMKWFGF